MQVAGYRFQLLDPALFWRKVVLLVVFFGLFIPLKVYQKDLVFWYGVFLLALHVYVLFVFLWRVQWRILAENRKPFLVRLMAIALFVFLLTIIKAGASVEELAFFVALSGLVHLALLLSLTVDVRPAPGDAARAETEP